jgi:hypothetical protein
MSALTITDFAADFKAKVSSVSGLETATSFTVGGRTQDPALLKAPLPTAWLELKAAIVDEPDYTHGPGSGLVVEQQTMMATFCAVLILAYGTDDDLLSVQYPFIEKVVNAVQGTTPDPNNPMNFRWRCIGFQRVGVYNDRLAYEVRFTLTYITNANAGVS